MKLAYVLDAEDFLVHQLYTASISKRIQRNRAISTWVVPAFYALCAIYLYTQGGGLTGVFLLVMLTVLWIVFYPMYQKRRYKNHYSNFINDAYTERFGQRAELDLQPSYISATDEGSEGRFNISEVKQVVHLSTHFLIQLRGGQALILPVGVVDSLPEFKAYFSDKGIAIVDELLWKWK